MDEVFSERTGEATVAPFRRIGIVGFGLMGGSLARSLGEAGIRRETLGPGGKDMTRLAGSGPEIWKDLLEYAPLILPEALEAVERALSGIRAKIKTGRGPEVADTMERTRGWFRGEPWN